MSGGGAQDGFPLGVVLAGEAGLEVEITGRLRGEGDAGLYDGVDRKGGRGWGLLVTVGPAQRRAPDELERALALRVNGVAPLRGIASLTGPDGARRDALIEGKPLGAPLVERALPLAPAAAIQLAIDLAQIAHAAAREGMALIGVRPELTFVREEGGALLLSGVMPRAEVFLATAGEGGAPPLFPDRYAAPELVPGEAAGPAADVFSICATVAFAATGQHPFEGSDPASQLAAMRAGRRRPFTGPDALGAILDRGLAAEPASRPDAAALVEALRGPAAPAPAEGIGSRLLGLFGRKASGSPPPPGEAPGPPDDDDDFPVGARLGGRDFAVTERLAGERWRGRYRGVDRGGAAVLVTIVGEQTVKLADLRRELEMNSPGIARLRYVGQVSGGPAAFDGLVEDEPPGAPVAQLTAPLGPRPGLSLGIALGEVVERAHGAGVVIGALFPELIYVTVEAGRLSVSGIAPRAERFVRTASRPNFGLPDLFASVYHAPEVLAGGARSTAADVFSLSALTAEWMSGQHPFDGDSYAARAVAIQMDARRRLEVPGGARAFLERGLAREPGQRPPIAEWLSAARGLLESLR